MFCDHLGIRLWRKDHRGTIPFCHHMRQHDLPIVEVTFDSLPSWAMGQFSILWAWSSSHVVSCQGCPYVNPTAERQEVTLCLRGRGGSMYLLFRVLQRVMSSLSTCLLTYLTLVSTRLLTDIVKPSWSESNATVFYCSKFIAFGENFPDCLDITLALIKPCGFCFLYELLPYFLLLQGVPGLSWIFSLFLLLNNSIRNQYVGYWTDAHT